MKMKYNMILLFIINSYIFLECKNSDKYSTVHEESKIEMLAKWELYKYNMTINDIKIDSFKSINFLELDLNAFTNPSDSLKILIVGQDTLKTFYFFPTYKRKPIDINKPNIIEFYGVTFKNDTIKDLRCCDRELKMEFKYIESQELEVKLLQLVKSHSIKVSPWITDYIEKNQL